jgi:signal transduction histidine kinase
MIWGEATRWNPGVRVRLLLAFFGISAFSVLAAAAGIYAFQHVGKRIDLVDARIPPTLTSLELSRSAERIIAAAPALLAATERARRDEVAAELNAEADRLNAKLLDLKSDRTEVAVMLLQIEPLVSSLTANLAELKDLVARRLDTNERIRTLRGQVFQTNDATQRLLAPWLSVMDGQLSGLLQGPQTADVRRLAALIQLQRSTQTAQQQFSAAVDMLTEASTTDLPRRLTVLSFQLVRALQDVETTAANLDPKLRPLFLEQVAKLREFAEGPNPIPKARKQELALVADGEKRLAENVSLSEKLASAVGQLASVARQDIADATSDALSVQRTSTRVLLALVGLSLLTSALIVWLYVGRNIVRRLTQLSDGMLAIVGGSLHTLVAAKGTDEIAAMGRAVEIFRKNTLERDELLAEKAQAAVNLEQQVKQRTAELAQSVEELRALGEVSQAVNSTLDLETVLTTIVGRAVQLSHTDTGAIYVFDEERKEFRLHATYGMSEAMTAAISGQHIGLGDSNIGLATTQRVPVQVPDIRDEPASPVNEIILREGYRGILVIPLLRPDHIVGALVVRRKTPGEFPQSTIELLQTFADQSVVALQNARLYENVEARTRELAKSLEDLRTTQDRLVQTEKLASLGSLTAGIAHEIKNPLNFVNNFSGISAEMIDELRQALEDVSLTEKKRSEITELMDTLRGNFDKVVQHGKRADAIVKNMLQHSRESSGEHRPVDVNALVEESLNLAWHGARAEKQGFEIALKQSFDPYAGEIDVFPQDIRRALLNVISNGFHAATKRRAEIESGDYEPTLTASTKNLGDRVEIRIRDNGTGISPEVKEKMFNPFFTTKPTGEGTGLGLSISHDIIVKQHAGVIEVDTQPGEFTEIRVVLPRVAALLPERS